MTEKLTYTTIFESVKNEIYTLKALVTWDYSSTLRTTEKKISEYLLSRNSIDSKELNTEFTYKMLDLINIINSTENPAAVLAQHKAIDKLFIGILSPELKAFTEDIKTTSASILLKKYLLEQNFMKTLNEVETLTTVAERASDLYSSDKTDAEYKIELWGIKEKIAGMTKEGIFTKELEHIKSLEAQLQLENLGHQISNQMEKAQAEFGRLPLYLDINLNFIPGVLPPLEQMEFRYGKVFADEEFLTLVAQEG